MNNTFLQNQIKSFVLAFILVSYGAILLMLLKIVLWRNENVCCSTGEVFMNCLIATLSLLVIIITANLIHERYERIKGDVHTVSSRIYALILSGIYLFIYFRYLA